MATDIAVGSLEAPPCVRVELGRGSHLLTQAEFAVRDRSIQEAFRIVSRAGLLYQELTDQNRYGQSCVPIEMIFQG